MSPKKAQLLLTLLVAGLCSYSDANAQDAQMMAKMRGILKQYPGINQAWVKSINETLAECAMRHDACSNFKVVCMRMMPPSPADNLDGIAASVVVGTTYVQQNWQMSNAPNEDRELLIKLVQKNGTWQDAHTSKFTSIIRDTCSSL